MRIIRLTDYGRQDRVKGLVYNSSCYERRDDDVLYFGIDPFQKFPDIPKELECLRKVVSVSDLHHGPLPISRCMKYLHTIKAEGVVVPYNIDIAYALKSIGINVLPRTIDYAYASFYKEIRWQERSDLLLHTGRLSRYHHRRRLSIELIADRGIPLYQYNGSPRQLWEMGWQHKFHLNIPIHNDRNCRFWETLLCGGLLFQPRLPEAQFQDIGISQEDISVPYDSVDDLAEKYAYFRANPLEASLIALKGSRVAWKILCDPFYSDLGIIKRLLDLHKAGAGCFHRLSFETLSSYYRRLESMRPTLICLG